MQSVWWVRRPSLFTVNWHDLLATLVSHQTEQSSLLLKMHPHLLVRWKQLIPFHPMKKSVWNWNNWVQHHSLMPYISKFCPKWVNSLELFCPLLLPLLLTTLEWPRGLSLRKEAFFNLPRATWSHSSGGLFLAKMGSWGAWVIIWLNLFMVPKILLLQLAHVFMQESCVCVYVCVMAF